MPTFIARIVFDENSDAAATPRWTPSSWWKACQARASTTSLPAPTRLADERLPVAPDRYRRHGRLPRQPPHQGRHRTHRRTARCPWFDRGAVHALAASAIVYSAGDIILGGDGSDTIMGRGGDDIIDGDKWLNVRIAVYAPEDVNTGHADRISQQHDNAGERACSRVRSIPASSRLSVKSQTVDADAVGDIDTAKFQGGA